MQLAGLEALAEFDFGLDISILDIVGFQRAVTNDALTNGGGVYGITNVVLPCGDFFGPMGPSCDASLYSDGLHPTAAAHRYIGRAALALLGVSSTVPAPAALTLFGFAFGLLCLSRRRYVGQHPAAA